MRLLKSYDIRLSLAAILIASGALTGCAFSKDADKPTTVEDPQVQTLLNEKQQQDNEIKAAQISESDIKISFDEMPEPNQYNMTVSWPKDIPLIDLSVDEMVYSNRRGGNYTVSVAGGKSIKIHMKTMDSMGSVVAEIDIPAVVPIDFVLGKSANVLQQDLFIHGNRLFISSDNPVVMNSKNVDIEVSEIISDDGRFNSFDSQDLNVAKVFDETVLNNSNVIIKAKKITGRLTFNMNGLMGKDGLDGAVLEKQLHFQEAKNGTDGSNGSLTNDDRPCNTEHCFQSVLCGKQPSNGGDGENGHDGVDGQVGVRGGNTGNITVIAEDYSLAVVQIGYSVGNGGKGGKGAPGHKGGLAGKAGASPKPCTAAVAGRSGTDGRPGHDAKNGDLGKVGTFTVPQGPDAQKYFIIKDTKQN